MLRMIPQLFLLSCLVFPLAAAAPQKKAAGEGTHAYDSFQEAGACASCHVDIARQHEQALMSQSFVHKWDEIEYFELALPHSLKESKVAGIKAGCNGCHAPLAFLAGDIPPKRPSQGSRANEGVSCDVCHSIVGFEGDVPFNFNYIVAPGESKQGRRRDGESPVHKITPNSFTMSAELCGICHNEKDPWGIWVKSTHLEWQDSPYARAGIVCQDCHMPPAPGNSSPGMAPDRPDIRQHLFHGAHDEGKLRGAAEVRIHPDSREVVQGQDLRVTVTVVNAKAGHMIPTGSAEERLVWLHVEAQDSNGTIYHLPVDRKGFAGEEMTIASASEMAYQDIGEIQGLQNFGGLKRDAPVPPGDRIFRLPYLDVKGRMTIAQWNTASLGPDYRLAPLRAVNESFTWTVPAGLPAGPVKLRATLWYSRLVSSVAEFLKVPSTEAVPILVNRHETSLTVLGG